MAPGQAGRYLQHLLDSTRKGLIINKKNMRKNISLPRKAETFTVRQPNDVTVKKNPKNKVKKDLHYSRLESLLLPNMFMCPPQHQRPLGSGCFSNVLLIFWCLGFFFPAKMMQKYSCYRFPTISRKSRFHTLRKKV